MISRYSNLVFVKIDVVKKTNQLDVRAIDNFLRSWVEARFQGGDDNLAVLSTVNACNCPLSWQARSVNIEHVAQIADGEGFENRVCRLWMRSVVN